MMLEIYKTPSKEIQEIILANLTYETVIDGLNEYFASGARNDYITVKMESDKQGSELYAAEAWADILIEWLRKKHDIFYRPGMTLDQVEAARSAAKICCLRAYIKDEISKRGLWCGADEDVPELVGTLFKAYDECVKHRDKNRKDAVELSEEIRYVVKEKESAIENLKERITELESEFKAVCDEDDIFRTRALKAEVEIRNLNAELATTWTKTSLINWLQQRARHKGVELDDAFLYSDDTQYDWTDIVNFLFDEIVKMRGELGAKESGIEDLKEYITLLEADLKKTKMEKEKFLIEVADRDEEIEELQKKGADLYLEHRRYIVNGIMNDIRHEASRNGFDLPEKIDGAPLSIERTFHDLLELLRKRTSEIKEVNDKRWKDLRDIYKALGRYDTCDNTDGFAKAVKARAEYLESLSRNAERETRKAVNDQLKKDTDYVADTLCDILEALGISKSNTAHLDVPGLKTKALQRARVIKSEHDRYQEQLGKATADYQALNEENQKLKDSQKSDTNQLIRDYCTKNGIIAPSRYLSDEACVEYLFSVINLKQKDRSFTILQDLYRDIFKKQPDGLSAEDIANKILDKVLETEDLLHKSVDSVNKECKAVGKQMVDDYKKDLLHYILKDIKEHDYRYDGLEKKSIEGIVDWIITMAISEHSYVALSDIYTTVASPVERLHYNNCDGPTVDHMKEYILRRFEGLRANTEYCLKRMSELDGCQKELKTKIDAKDDEISRLKDLINAMNEEVKDM